MSIPASQVNWHCLRSDSTAMTRLRASRSGPGFPSSAIRRRDCKVIPY